jgi:peptidoglycan hydrolase-like protein with peptidoglycan-binding domain
MTWETKRRDGGGVGADRGSERTATSVPGKITLTEQLRFKAPQATTPGTTEEAVASQGVGGPAAPFPHGSQIEALFGRPLAASAHTDDSARHASAQLGAEGFAFRGQVGFASESPSLFVAAHEAAHTMQDADTVQRHAGGAGGDAYEAHADAVATRVVNGESAADLIGAGGGASGVRRFEDSKHVDPRPEGAAPATKDDSARFGNDVTLDNVSKGGPEVKQGDRGVEVTKVQQALIDLGYLLPSFGVDGKFEGETKAAVLKFQQDQALPPTGKLDKGTLDRLNTVYDTRKPYIDAAKHDPAKPGTRALSAADKTAAVDAMVPKPGAGGVPAVFTRVTPDGKDYGDEIRDALTHLVKTFHKDLYDDKVGLRADPAKNLHDWSVMEGPPKASKQVTDTLYASNYGGSAAFPAMTHAGGNLIDQWTDEESRNSLLADPQKKAKARDKVVYLINSNCDAVNAKHGAVASNPTEKAILDPIVDSFVSDKTKVQTMLDLDIGWEGAQLGGVVYLQRYKSQNADKDKAKEENRVQMWDLFQTCIHEYIHTLAHPTYQAWAQSFATAGDATRYNTLIEGFCDFFTLNVRKAMTIDAPVAAQVEGPYANGNPPPPDNSGVYPSHAQAEQVVSIVGIKNAQAGYFGGQTKLMGAA